MTPAKMTPAKVSNSAFKDLSSSGTGPQPNLSRATELVLALMEIPGASGGEQQVADYIRRRLRRAGGNLKLLESDQAHQRTRLKGQIGNLVFRVKGNARSPRRMLVAHMDTVPICLNAQPLLKGNRIASKDPRGGLGADDRAGVAVLLNTALEILEKKLPSPPLTFLWSVQEEVGLQGVRHAALRMLHKPQLAFNFDGGSPEKLTIGATGGYRMQIKITGLASHAGGAPEKGVSAIAIAGLAIADLQQRGWHGQIIKGRQRGTSNIGFIHGGTATNVVADSVELKVEARSYSGSFRNKIVDQIKASFLRAAKEVVSEHGDTGSVAFTGQTDYESFRLLQSEPCVKVAKSAVRAVGGEPVPFFSAGGLDANWLTARGIPTVTLGCGQLHQHTCREQLDLPWFHKACKIALYLATAQS
ncbi:MAG: M20/M25/M40 family metallo-hydrolase [Pirellulales bacterium]|nr:M20/M25/M40 family metallo-hydrolase [Pirellulales bacterium]